MSRLGLHRVVRLRLLCSIPARRLALSSLFIERVSTTRGKAPAYLKGRGAKRQSHRIQQTRAMAFYVPPLLAFLYILSRMNTESVSSFIRFRLP